MSGPGPHAPPFFKAAEDEVNKGLHAVAAALGVVNVPAPPAVDEPVEAPAVEAMAAANAAPVALATALDKAHAAERAALDAVHKREVDAVDALEGFVANVRGHLDVLAARFPDLVGQFRAALSRL
jgi:hypothetical protein